MKTAKSDLLIVNNNRAQNRVLNPASRLGFISNSACENLFLRLLAVCLFNYIEVTDFFKQLLLSVQFKSPISCGRIFISVCRFIQSKNTLVVLERIYNKRIHCGFCQ